MEEQHFLQSAVIFLVAAAVAVPLFMRLGLSAVLGLSLIHISEPTRPY